MRIDNHRSELITKAMQLKIERELLTYSSDLLDIALYHSQTLDLELGKNDNHMDLRLAVCLITLWFFSQLCSVTTLKYEGRFYVDWTRSKFLVAFCGLMGALMGIGSGTGLLSYCGYPYNAVCDAMPFLVLGECQ